MFCRARTSHNCSFVSTQRSPSPLWTPIVTREPSSETSAIVAHQPVGRNVNCSQPYSAPVNTAYSGWGLTCSWKYQVQTHISAPASQKDGLRTNANARRIADLHDCQTKVLLPAARSSGLARGDSVGASTWRAKDQSLTVALNQLAGAIENNRRVIGPN